eukprot:scaffold14662_cov214-Alexandrium_tamarense.AAC.2
MGSQWWRMDSIKGGENPVQAPSGCALVRMSGRERSSTKWGLSTAISQSIPAFNSLMMPASSVEAPTSIIFFSRTNLTDDDIL